VVTVPTWGPGETTALFARLKLEFGEVYGVCTRQQNLDNLLTGWIPEGGNHDVSWVYGGTASFKFAAADVIGEVLERQP
jgi:hypothetical protein